MSAILRFRKQKRKKSATKHEKEAVTDTSRDLSIVVGASSPLGVSLVEELIKRNKKVRVIISKGKELRKQFKDTNIEICKINLNLEEELLDCIEPGSKVYHCLKTSFYGIFGILPFMLNNIVQAVKLRKAKFIYADKLTVYTQTKHKRRAKEGNSTNISDIGLMRKKLAESILREDKLGEISATIVRFPDFYGPHVVNDFSNKVFEKPLIDQTAKWYYDLNQKHSFIYIKDAARVLADIAEHSDSYGEVWHVAGAEPITGNQFIKLISSEINKDIKAKVQSKFWINFLSILNPELRRVKDLSHSWEKPFIIDGTKFKDLFPNFEPTQHEEAISETIDWFRERIRKRQASTHYGTVISQLARW
jgi:nucleoside-diphosphate-sugar epimerase